MKKLFSITAIGLTALITSVAIPALAQDAPPGFPSCTDKIFTQDGDRAHYDFGLHQIAGDGLKEGSDDVYTLGEGNFLQCYCPVQGEDNDTGIQTNFWNVGQIAQEIIDGYIGLGWISISNGLDWNLDEGPYLAKNSNYSCIQPEPTPTTEPSTAPSPTVTPTPTPTSGGQVQGTTHSEPGPASAPVCHDPQPDAPTLLSITKSGDDSVELVWTTVTDAKHYLISYGLESGKAQFGVPDVGNVTSYRIGGLDLDNAKYYFRVGVTKGCQVSELSNELSYPREIGGQVLGLATTGVDFNLLKYWIMLSSGFGAAVYGTKNILGKWIG